MNKKLDTLVKDLQEAFVWDKDYYRKVNKLMVLKLFSFIVSDYIYIHRMVRTIKTEFQPIKKISVSHLWWYEINGEYKIKVLLYIQRKFPYCIIDKIKEGLRK